ncbi:MAG: Coenzyme A biosynthesis bifunctional protein CoaBC [Lentisphaerae bacterium ADurb.BinA184]|nr:MAG: Coenzyme A biosynthesis bifunctional protein CoaBC [Lentisphaerae bacterium ADurb.BinA184]
MNESPTAAVPPDCIALGVTSSIAAYKAADLTSQLVQAGIAVHVVMTPNATKLVHPQTFMTLSRHPVTVDLWQAPDWRPEHVSLAERIALLVVAPATANFLGKYAHGVADDALTTLALSHSGPVLVAPAMNPRMWRHPAVRENVRILRERGVAFVGPERGRVACGEETEAGRMASVESVRRAVEAHLAVARRAGLRGGRRLRVLVTAGPTREALDPVRYLSNRSSGRMGYALAEVAAAAGHDVVLVSGPTGLAQPQSCRVTDVVTAEEMARAVEREFPSCDLLIMCAAVADFRPAAPAAGKVKKGAAGLTVEFERTRDILETVAGLRREGQTVVGFAAETEAVLENARGKLTRKRLDWIVANDVRRADVGFGGDCNQVTMVSRAGAEVSLPRLSKIETAAEILLAVTAAG